MNPTKLVKPLLVTLFMLSIYFHFRELAFLDNKLLFIHFLASFIGIVLIIKSNEYQRTFSIIWVFISFIPFPLFVFVFNLNDLFFKGYINQMEYEEDLIAVSISFPFLLFGSLILYVVYRFLKMETLEKLELVE